MRRKHPRLPNGYGSIRYLGKNRKNPYAVLAPPTKNNIKGIPIYDKPIAYTDSWNKAFSVLVMHHAGTYKKGTPIPDVLPENTKDSILQSIVDEILRRLAPEKLSDVGMTFKEVYSEFLDWKFNQTKREYSQSLRYGIISAYKNCSMLHNKIFANLKYKDLQKVVDDCPLKHASKELIVSLFKQMYKYAMISEIVEKDYSANVEIKEKDDDEHGIPFSDEQLAFLWSKKNDSTARMLLIMCYSGFRINEYRSLKIENGFFIGGSKTEAGKNRYVPIHSAIASLVEERIKEKGCLLKGSVRFNTEMYSFLEANGIEKHTPHDCRHTFARLCDKFSVYENDKKRMLGHAFSDVTNRVYGHVDLDKLKAEIEKIKAF